MNVASIGCGFISPCMTKEGEIEVLEEIPEGWTEAQHWQKSHATTS